MSEARTETSDDDLTLDRILQRFATEEAARGYFESLRWPNGPVCPHCGNRERGRIYKVTANPGRKIRAGLYKCADCSDQFTVTVGTVMEDSHIPLNKWLVAFFVLCASKSEVSALQLQRQLELGSYRSARFLCQRIRSALTDSTPDDNLNRAAEPVEGLRASKVTGCGRGYVGYMSAAYSLVDVDRRAHTQAGQAANGSAIAKRLCDQVSSNASFDAEESRIYEKAYTACASHDVVTQRAKSLAASTS